MHIYCDESGGQDRGLMYISTVIINETEARKLLKKFRKKTGAAPDGEVKGSKLTIDQQIIFIKMISKYDYRISVAYCDSNTTVGGWLFNNIREHDIWSGLIIDAISNLNIPQNSQVTIFPDGGRYNREIISECEDKIRSKLILDGMVSVANVYCTPSHNKPGIQVADVISNIFWRIDKYHDPEQRIRLERHIRRIQFIKSPISCDDCPQWLKTTQQ